MKPDPSRPWEVIEPVTNAVVAQHATEGDARTWMLGARAELRNAGHIPPQYSIRNRNALGVPVAPAQTFPHEPPMKDSP